MAASDFGRAPGRSNVDTLALELCPACAPRKAAPFSSAIRSNSARSSFAYWPTFGRSSGESALMPRSTAVSSPFLPKNRIRSSSSAFSSIFISCKQLGQLFAYLVQFLYHTVLRLACIYFLFFNLTVWRRGELMALRPNEKARPIRCAKKDEAKTYRLRGTTFIFAKANTLRRCNGRHAVAGYSAGAKHDLSPAPLGGEMRLRCGKPALSHSRSLCIPFYTRAKPPSWRLCGYMAVLYYFIISNIFGDASLLRKFYKYFRNIGRRHSVLAFFEQQSHARREKKSSEQSA